MNQFDILKDRTHTFSYKWQVKPGELPMWVADMDFETAPAIKKALEERVAHGVFGYTDIPDEWYKSYQNWWLRRHHFNIKQEWLIYSTGIIPTISSSIRQLTSPNENVVVLTPVYNIFYNCIENNGRRVLECPLHYKGDCYVIDFEDLEKKLSNPQTSMMLLCNPHNPTGQIWEREVLARIGELAEKYHVIVLSDEVHCDLVDPGCEYIPFASVSKLCAQNSITAIAPTKCFNIAGIQTSAVVVPNEFLRHKVWRGLNTDECGEPNVFAIVATLAAFNESETWLDELRDYVLINKNYVRDFIKNNLPQLKVVPSKATYLLWLDCHAITQDSRQLAQEIRDKTGLYLNEGSQYRGDGRYYLRMNLATSLKNVEDACERLKKAIQ